MKSLYEIFLDGHEKKSQKWHNYFAVYEHHFSRFRNENPKILEIGVAGGGSLLTWRDYFGPDAEIIGCDINPKCKALESEGFKIVIGDQSDPKFLEKLADVAKNADIIIDDGGHTAEQTIRTFEYLYPALKYGGVYLVEDVSTAIWPRYNDRLDGLTFMDLAKSIAEKLTWWHITPNNHRFKHPPEKRVGEVEVPWVTRNVWSVSFYDSIVAFEKRHVSEPWNDRR